MEFKEALKQAKVYFQQKGEGTTACALDAGTHWIFYGGEPGVTQVGSAGIKINRETGALEEFILPDIENFELLDRATPVELKEGK